MAKSLTREQFRALDSQGLASRIDLFFEEDFKGRYGDVIQQFNVVTAGQILATIAVQKLPELNRKRALLFFYRSQFQSALCHQYFGSDNQNIHGKGLTQSSWEAPKLQILAASTRQAQIVSSRVAFECLMEFLHFVITQNTLSGKSKRKAFKKWCIAHQEKFGWLIFYLVVVNRYDREHRTAEVHGTSFVAAEALRCDIWAPVDGELDLVNLMLDIWRSIVLCLNGQEVSGYSCLGRDLPIFAKFDSWRTGDLDSIWAEHTETGEP